MYTGIQPASLLGPIAVHTDGILPTDAAELIRSRLAPVLGGWASHSRVRLTRLTSAGLARPVVGQLDVRLALQRVRAQVATATMSEMAQLLPLRAVAQLCQVPGTLAECLQTRSMPTVPPPAPELRPPAARRLVRHKMCRPATIRIDEAIGVLEMMDYPFHLFRDRASHQDSVVVRLSRGRYRVVQVSPDPIRMMTSTAVELAPAPWRTVAEAIDRLDLTGAAFEIFADKATGRAAVLYARYDGHYAMLRPAVPLWSTG